MTHTRCSVSRQTSTKWLPVPSVPRCMTLLVFASRGYFSHSASNRALSTAQASTTEAGGSPHAPLSRRPRPSRAAMRDRRFDSRADTGKVVGQVARHERGARGHHAAADIHANSGGNNRAFGRDDRADGCANPNVNIGHGGHMLEDERHFGRLGHLLLGALVYRHVAGPGLDRHAAFDMGVFEFLFHRF
jgi:hypothetical protein